MNRFGWFVAAAYVALALVSAGVYVASVSEFVDYSETQLRFTQPGSVHVAYANLSWEGTRYHGTIRWRFENDGRLPVTIAIFQFRVYVDNTTDPTPWYEPMKLDREFWRDLSLQEDRYTGPLVLPAGFHDETWEFNVTSPEDIGKIVRDPGDGKIHLIFLYVRVVYYIGDVSTRQVQDIPASFSVV